MKVLVLGCGLQGKAAIYDLCQSGQVTEVIAADGDEHALDPIMPHLDQNKLRRVKLDAENHAALVNLMEEADIVVDLMPMMLMNRVAEAAVEAGKSVVNTMYRHQFDQSLHEKALARGVTLLPEVGLDPGIDLILCSKGVNELDEVHELHSWTGGFPHPDAAHSPLKYKIAWTWYGVLLSYDRPSRIMKDGRVIDIPAKEEFSREHLITFDFPGVGRLEAFPNGDAVQFCEHLGIMDTVKATSRRTMRWEGHTAFWKPLVDLGFLSDEPVAGLPGVTPKIFMDKHLEPKLHYRQDEKDLVVMRNVIKGLKDGRQVTLTYDLVDSRDLTTGLFAMNRTVGFTASIVAQMIVNGEITKKGLLSAIKDVPHEPVIQALTERGIIIKESMEYDQQE